MMPTSVNGEVSEHNSDWRNWELPSLQHNPLIKQIILVEVDQEELVYYHSYNNVMFTFSQKVV